MTKFVQFRAIAVVYRLFFFMPILIFSEQTSAQPITAKGLSARTHQENGEELTSSVLIREDVASNEARFLLYKNPVAQYLVDRLGIFSSFLSIWLWAEHRKRHHDLNKGELLDGWSSELENLDSRIEHFVDSIKLLICQLDSKHASKKNLSVECKNRLKQHKYSTKMVHQPISSSSLRRIII